MAEEHVREGLKKRGATGVIDQPRILDRPDSPTIVDARWEDDRFILKLVETRPVRVFVGETRHGERLSRDYRIDLHRAVNLLCLHADGLLEMRIQSHRNTSQYGEDVQRLWRLVGDILPGGSFSEFSIMEAKNNIFSQRAKLSREIRYSDSTLRNEYGTSLTAATSRDTSNLVEDPGAESGLSGFLAHGGYCDSLNIWFQSDDRETHVLFSKEINEFIVTAQCSRADYDYVLARIRQLNA